MPGQRPRCGVDGCKSRRFTVDNGLTFCHRGHLQEGIIEQEQDFEDVNWSASQTTRIHDSQRQAEIASQLEKLGGPKGLELFLIAFQLILRKNAWVLVQDKGINGADGDQFERVLGDLWGLRLQVLDDKGLDVETDERRRRQLEMRKRPKPKPGKRKRRTGRQSRARDVVEDDATDTEAEADEDDATATETEVEADDEEEVEPRPPRSLPKLVETLGLLYITALILRIPLPLSKLQYWAQEEELCWTRAIHEIPSDMRKRLAAGYQLVFEPRGSLRDGELHKCVADLILMLQDRFVSLKLPPLNHYPILLDYLIKLGLPLHLSSAVENLAKLLSLDFTTAGVDYLSMGWFVRELPELQVVALIVIAAQLYFPFDTQPRFATSHADFAVSALDWDRWNSIHEELDLEFKQKVRTASKLTYGQQIKAGPKDVYEMDMEQLDAYMDWYQENWTEQDIKVPTNEHQEYQRALGTGLLSKVYAVFPPAATVIRNPETTDPNETQRDEKLQERVASSLKFRDIVSERAEEKRSNSTTPVLRAGMDYIQFRQLHNLRRNPQAIKFYTRAAKTAGVPVKMLLGAVNAMEDRIRLKEEELHPEGAEANGDPDAPQRAASRRVTGANGNANRRS